MRTRYWGILEASVSIVFIWAGYFQSVSSAPIAFFYALVGTWACVSIYPILSIMENEAQRSKEHLERIQETARAVDKAGGYGKLFEAMDKVEDVKK